MIEIHFNEQQVDTLLIILGAEIAGENAQNLSNTHIAIVEQIIRSLKACKANQL